MGAHAKEFMELRMMEDDYKNLPPEYREQIEIKSIDVDNFDYSDDVLWQKLKKESLSAYRALKKREFKLRHGK